MTSSLLLDRNIFQRFFHAASHPLEAFKVGIWSVTMLFESLSLKDSLSKSCSDRTAKKTEQVFCEKKELFLKSASWLSLTGFGFDWANRNEVIPLGSALGSFVSHLTYGLTGVVSAVRLWDTLKDFGQNLADYRNAETEGQKNKIMDRQIYNLIKIISQVSLLAWGILGVTAAVIASAALTLWLDLFLAISLSCFIAEQILYNLPKLAQSAQADVKK